MQMPATVRKEDRFRSAGVRGTSWRICLVSAALAVSFPAAASKPQVIISPVVRAEISTASDLHVHIDRPTPLPADSILVITGLPKSVTFSTGSAITTGIWEVPLAGLKNLKIVVSAVEASRSDLSLYLAIKKKDRLVVLASARSILLVEASTGKDRQAVTKEAEDARLTETKSAQKTTSEQKTTGEGPGDLAIPSVRRLMEGHLSSPAPETTDKRKPVAKKTEDERIAERIKQAKGAVEEARQQLVTKQAEMERLAEALKIEQARKAEEARAEEARRQAAAKQAETERLAAEALKIEQARKAEEARAEEARRQAAAKQAEIKLIDATGVEKVGERNTDKAKQSQIASPKDSSPMGALRVEPPEGESQQKSDIAQSERLVSRGDEYLSQGNFAVAREYFLRAARSGLAIAALKLGETYDPHELGRMNVQGLVPDSAEARKWYTKALQLGSGEAQLKLGRLGGN